MSSEMVVKVRPSDVSYPAGRKGSGGELRHLAGSPGGGGGY